MIKLSVDTYGKKDSIGLLPADLIANAPKFTGRKERTEAQIAKMVTSLLTEGQIEDIVYRINFERQPVLIAGMTRALAADRINKQGLTDVKGNKYSDKSPFILTGRCKNFKQDKSGDLEALMLTWFENSTDTRTPLTAVDEAEFITVLSENYGLTDAEIAKRLRQEPAWVSRRKNALLLDTETQNKLAAGEISFDTAMTYLEIAPEDRANVTAAAVEAVGVGKKVTAKAVKEAARKTGAKTRKSLKRTDGEFSTLLDELIETSAVGPLQSFLFGLKDFRNGVIDAAEVKALSAKLEGNEEEIEEDEFAAAGVSEL